jgi:hypothetical protein
MVDFGLARVAAETLASMRVAGTPAYMAPEAWDGARSEQTDLWSVAVICYELFCGRRPFRGSGPAEVRQSVLLQDPPPLPGHVPEDVAKAVLKALEKRERDRFPSAKAFLAALAPPTPSTVDAAPTPTPKSLGGFSRAGHPVTVEGEWTTSTRYEGAGEETFLLRLEMDGTRVWGEEICTGGPDEGRRYEIQGHFMNMVLRAEWWCPEPHRIEAGTMCLLLANGQTLEGLSTYYNPTTRRIDSVEQKWKRARGG